MKTKRQTSDVFIVCIFCQLAWSHGPVAKIADQEITSNQIDSSKYEDPIDAINAIRNEAYCSQMLSKEYHQLACNELYSLMFGSNFAQDSVLKFSRELHQYSKIAEARLRLHLFDYWVNAGSMRTIPVRILNVEALISKKLSASVKTRNLQGQNIRIKRTWGDFLFDNEKPIVSQGSTPIFKGRDVNQFIRTVMLKGDVVFWHGSPIEDDVASFVDEMVLGYLAWKNYKSAISLDEEKDQVILNGMQLKEVYNEIPILSAEDVMPENTKELIKFARSIHLSKSNINQSEIANFKQSSKLEGSPYTAFLLTYSGQWYKRRVIGSIGQEEVNNFRNEKVEDISHEDAVKRIGGEKIARSLTEFKNKYEIKISIK